MRQNKVEEITDGAGAGAAAAAAAVAADQVAAALAAALAAEARVHLPAAPGVTALPALALVQAREENEKRRSQLEVRTGKGRRKAALEKIKSPGKAKRARRNRSIESVIGIAAASAKMAVIARVAAHSDPHEALQI